MGNKDNHLRARLQRPPLTHIGIVVPDLEEAIDCCRKTFSIGPLL